MKHNIVYLDHNSTTTLNSDVIETMNNIFQSPLNCSSIHTLGQRAKMILENSRETICRFFNIDRSRNEYDIVFTSSGTEANNLVINNFLDGDIFISATEHKSIYDFCKKYDNVHLVPVNRYGILNADELLDMVKRSKAKKKLVSIMLANNETGIIQPLDQITHKLKECGCYIHSDMVQAIGKTEIDFNALSIDFASISAHKFGGPIGAAGLIHKTSYQLHPMFLGGGQEKGVRPGTENVALIAGFAKAIDVISGNIKDRIYKMRELRNLAEWYIKTNFNNAMSNNINNNIPTNNVIIVGDNVNRLPNTSMIINPSKSSEAQVIALDLAGILVSSGSACSSGKVEKSHVLSNMGFSDIEAASAIRVSFGVNNTNDDVLKFIDAYKNVCC